MWLGIAYGSYDMCTKFHLKILNFFSLEVRLKFLNDIDNDTDTKGITIARLFFFEKQKS